MLGKLLKSALIAPVAAVLLTMAAPVSAPAAGENRNGVFSHQGRWTVQQDRWSDRRGTRQARRDDRDDRWSERRDDRRDRWSDRRHDHRDRWRGRRDHRQEWWQTRWQRHWDRWDRRAAQRRHRHPHGQKWHPHRY